MKPEIVIPSLFLITVWTANITDLIRGSWFYETTSGIVLWNAIGILSMITIIYEIAKANTEGKNDENNR